MGKGIGQIHVRGRRNAIEVDGMGQTPRGQRFIRSKSTLKVKSFADKDFKTELATAIAKMYQEDSA